MADIKQKEAAKQFAEYWKGKGYEKGQSQPYWLSLLRDVLGVEHPEDFISFEDQVKLDHTSFIDGYIKETHVMIEQKSLDKDLSKAIKQSDGSFLTPFQQAKRYASEMPYSLRPRWIITCNFQEMYIYDMEKPTGEAQILRLEDLPKEYYRLNFITDTGNLHLEKEKELSFDAGDIVGKLYDAFYKQYEKVRTPTEDDLKSLNALCVRLVFCFYAEDSGIFGKKDLFYNYISQFDAIGMREALIRLFKILDTEDNDRDPFLREDLKAFPYVNGGLFEDENIIIPQFTNEIRTLIIEDASKNFDWSGISPTIFGAVFESTLNPDTRRSGGMHYTPIESIHKVIDPLFLDDLKEEFEKVKAAGSEVKVKNAAKRFQEKISTLTFLDPAAGSGNFLTETYLCLRRLENEALKLILGDQIKMRTRQDDPIRVTIDQFYGIEINDFAVSVAKTAMWIAEAQTMQETTEILHQDLDFLPLKTNVNIVKGNALRMDWGDVVSVHNIDFIISNPPFVGARKKKQHHKDDIELIFSGWKNIGDLDYVCCWYKKAIEVMKNTKIKAALVSTNSITQGGAVANLWKPLFKEGLQIIFAHRTFQWDSEANLKAHVHCVIVGFSMSVSKEDKIIYDGNSILKAHNINGYLVDAPNISVDSRNKPICNVPQIKMGNQPIDNGEYLFDKQGMDDFVKKEPLSKEYFHPWYGSKEFINRKPRYCLYLGNCTPNILAKMPRCLETVAKVREYRLDSDRASTRKLADTPTRFQTENMPTGDYIVIPEVSSENRLYVPMGYMDDTVLCSNKLRLMPNANLYHFGILQSNVHNAWVRAVCGRLETRIDYSIKIVFNNFPWPEPTPDQKERITRTAKGILEARALYPESSLADLYNDLIMPPELRKAHQDNDKAVWDAYGRMWNMKSESDCVSYLINRYTELTEGK